MSRVTLQGLPILGLAIVLWWFIPGFKRGNSPRPIKVKQLPPLARLTPVLGLDAILCDLYWEVRIYRTPWHWIFVNAGGSQTVGIESNSFTVRAFSFAWLLGLVVLVRLVV